MKTIDKARKKVYLDSKHIVHIVGNILMLVGFILALIYQNERAYSFYWLAIGLALIGSLYYCDQYSKEGKTQIRKTDKNWNLKISGKGSDKIIYVMLVSSFLVCAVYILEIFFKDITRSNGAVIYSFVIMVVYQIILVYLVNRMYQQVIKTEKSIIDSRLKK